MEDLDLNVEIDPADFQRPASLGGRRASALSVTSRPLAAGDLAELDGPRQSAVPSVGKIREAHHAVARLLADGRPLLEVSGVTGYGTARLWTLQQDPAFQELVDFYRRNKELAYVDLHQRLAALGLQATAELMERLAAEPEKMSDDMLRELVKLSADRTGHGPSSSTKNVHVHVEMGDRLAAARQRAQAHREGRATASRPPAVIDGEVADVRLLPSG